MPEKTIDFDANQLFGDGNLENYQLLSCLSRSRVVSISGISTVKEMQIQCVKAL